MATVIDALIVTLGLDPAGFKKGQAEAGASMKKTKDEAARTAKDMEARGKQAAQFFSQIKKEVLGLTVAIMGAAGIKNFIEKITVSDAATGRMAKNLGLATTELSALQNAAEIGGSSAGGMTATLKGLNEQLQNVAIYGGDPAFLQTLGLSGVNVGKFISNTTTMRERILMLADAAKRMGPQQAGFMFKGIADPDTILMLTQGREAVEALIAKGAELGVVNENDAKQAQERQRVWRELSITFTRTADVLLNELSPAIVTVMKNVSDWTVKNKEFINSGIVSSIKEIGSAVSDLWTLAGPILRLIGEGWHNIFTWVHAAADEVRQYKESSAAKQARDGVDDSKLGRATAHVLAFFGNDAARDALDLERRQLSSPAPASTGNKAPIAGTTSALFSSLEKQFGLPTGLLDSMWQQESGRGKNMTSPKGARGHFQFMPATAKEYGLDDPDDLAKSALAAAKKMADLLKQFGGLDKALAAYNWGDGRVARNGLNGAPLETLNYIKGIKSRLPGTGGNVTTNDVKIDRITVNSQATDAAGIARDIDPALKQYLVGSQNNFALQ